MNKTSSAILHPYRALGLITDSIPGFFYSLGTANFLTTSVGKSFQVWNIENLHMAIISPRLVKKIECLASQNEYTFTSCENEIYVWKRVALIKTLKDSQSIITHLYIFGSYLIGLNKDPSIMIWDSNKHSFLHKIDLQPTFTPSCILHPDTYINKIIIGSEEGRLQLWNINTSKLIYEYASIQNRSTIKCMIQSPALDVVLIGQDDGFIHLFNIKTDEIILEYKQSGSITCASYRQDDELHPIMATGNDKGQIVLWNLQTNQYYTKIRAHSKEILNLIFIPGQPLLLSLSSDNSIKIWIFDQFDNTPRLLKSRDGHIESPNIIKFYGGERIATLQEGADASAYQIISCSSDKSFRVFHAIRDQLNCELSQGSIISKSKKRKINPDNLKLNRIIHFAFSESREKDWSNIVTCHFNDQYVYTWSFINRSKSDLVLYPPDQNDIILPMCCSISVCGNFCTVGYNNGDIHSFNLQSGRYIGSYPIKEQKAIKIAKNIAHIPKVEGGLGKHTKSVTGLSFNNLNKYIISTSIDGYLKIFDINSMSLHREVNVGFPISHLLYHQESNLIAVACDDFKVRLYDFNDLEMVRIFSGHVSEINDICYSPDGHWLLSCSTDSTIRIYEITTSRCIDYIRFDDIPLSISMNITGEYIATSFYDNPGIYIWSNRTFYETVTMTEKTVPILIDIPDNPNITLSKGEEHSISPISLVEPSSDGLITLEGIPKSQWVSLIHLEEVKERNKPIEPPKKPELAPFFIPTVAGLHPTFAQDTSQQSVESEDRVQNKIFVQNELSRVISCTKQNSKDDVIDYEPIITFLKTLNSSGIDFQIETLCNNDFDEIGINNLEQFLLIILSCLEDKHHFELIQTVLYRTITKYNLTLKLPRFNEIMKDLNKVQQSIYQTFNELILYNNCLLKLFGNLQI